MSKRRGSAIGTRAWTRNYRAPLEARLLAGQSIPCAARRTKHCRIMITNPRHLRIGHVKARAHGGTDTDGLQAECDHCSNHEGGVLAHQTRNPNPSREW